MHQQRESTPVPVQLVPQPRQEYPLWAGLETGLRTGRATGLGRYPHKGPGTRYQGRDLGPETTGYPQERNWDQ